MLERSFHSSTDSRGVNMKLVGRVPKVEDAIQHFHDMAYGKLPKRQSGKGRKRKLFGSWYDSGPSMMKTQPHTTLVTPVAMDVEQAKAKLRYSTGKITGKSQPYTEQSNGKSTEKKVTTKGGSSSKKHQSTSRQRRGKTYQDNFA